MAHRIRRLDVAARNGTRSQACSGMGDNLAELRAAITDWKPDIAFNLLEEFQGIVTYDQYVVAFLELMRQPYTGCNPRGMMISRDKALSKQILSYHRIPTAKFALLPRNRRYRVPKRLKFPLFVKSATEDASLGIAQASIVHDARSSASAWSSSTSRRHSDALVEEYIEGREIYIGVHGQRAADDFSALGTEFRHAAGRHGRDRDAQGQMGPQVSAEARHRYGACRDLPEGLPPRMARLARRIYRALNLSGYARIDLRVTPDGNCSCSRPMRTRTWRRPRTSRLSAQSSGVDYERTLERIMTSGLGYQAAWRQV